MLGQGLSLKLDLDGCFDGKVGGFPHFLLNHESIEASIYFSIQVDGLFSGSSKRLLNLGLVVQEITRGYSLLALHHKHNWTDFAYF